MFVCVCALVGVEGGGYYEPTERQPIGLSRLPALNNGGVKGRKEEERSAVRWVRPMSCTADKMKAAVLKMYNDGLMTCYVRY